MPDMDKKRRGEGRRWRGTKGGKGFVYFNFYWILFFSIIINRSEIFLFIFIILCPEHTIPFLKVKQCKTEDLSQYAAGFFQSTGYRGSTPSTPSLSRQCGENDEFSNTYIVTTWLAFLGVGPACIENNGKTVFHLKQDQSILVKT